MKNIERYLTTNKLNCCNKSKTKKSFICNSILQLETIFSYWKYVLLTIFTNNYSATSKKICICFQYSRAKRNTLFTPIEQSNEQSNMTINQLYCVMFIKYSILKLNNKAKSIAKTIFYAWKVLITCMY